MSSEFDTSREAVDAVVTRVAGDGLIYARDEHRTFALTRQTSGFESLGKVSQGSSVRLSVVSRTRIVESVTRREMSVSPRTGGSAGIPEHQAKQLELCPEEAPQGEKILYRAIPPRMRELGKVQDRSALLPGDLFLIRDVQPNKVSQAIVEVQRSKDYGELDARWTQAAMYVGDGLHVVAATLDDSKEGGIVRLTSLDEYCLGASCLRVRRPRCFAEDKKGWSTSVRGMSRLSRQYDFSGCIKFWVDSMHRRPVLGSKSLQRLSSAACISSTLYADSFAQATRRALGEPNGYCVPAWLSRSDEFRDLEIKWLSIKAPHIRANL